ncbi:MAG: NAD(P)/FAD-dependent oxidoreductase [Lachnospiraceae bacterium]
MKTYDIVIIGGGPAGLSAAVSAKKSGTDSILILERDKELGGILNQCIHNGFGLHTFKEELTGPEYAGRFIEQVKELQIEYKLHTMVMDISSDKVVTAMNSTDGLFEIRAGAVILAMGCRERSRGALNIPGYRPAGIFSAGTAQRLVNMEGYLPGRKVVILGSGDIGLIMARRMTLEGAQVQVVAELMPYSGGLKRNIVQCLDDYGIPLKLSHTVVEIRGKERVEGITLAQVDEKGRPIAGTEEEYECDTLLLSVGLIPENELSSGMGVELSRVTSGPVVNEGLETNIEGVFACGNVLHVHDLVDFVSEEAAAAGRNAARYVQEAGRRKGEGPDAAAERAHYGAQADRRNSVEQGENDLCKAAGRTVEIRAVDGVRYTVPSRINAERMEDIQTVRFRVGGVYKNCFVSVYLDEERILHRKRPVMAPGEMEEVKLKREELLRHPDLKAITVKVEEV